MEMCIEDRREVVIGKIFISWLTGANKSISIDQVHCVCSRNWIA